MSTKKKTGEEMHNSVQEAYNQIHQMRERKLNGLPNCIPVPFDRFSHYYPGIEPSSYTIVTAGTGVGKSKFAKFLTVVEAMKLVRQHPDLDIRIRWYALEESKINFWHTMMSFLLAQTGRMRISVRELKSVHDVLEEEKLEVIDQVRPILDRWKERIEVIDDIRHPTGIFKNVEQELLKNGVWATKNMHYGGEDHQVRDHFVYDNPNVHYVIVVDHASLLYTEAGCNTLRDSIIKLSSEYFIQLRDKFRCSPVLIQQQVQGQEELKHDYRGRLVVSKLEPSISGLGDAKVTARDADVVLGLFAPDRFEITSYRGYKINKLQDAFRSLQILKQRNGVSNMRTGLFFDGLTGYFEELPQADVMTETTYNEYRGRLSNKLMQRV